MDESLPPGVLPIATTPDLPPGVVPNLSSALPPGVIPIGPSEPPEQRRVQLTDAAPAPKGDSENVAVKGPIEGGHPWLATGLRVAAPIAGRVVGGSLGGLVGLGGGPAAPGTVPAGVMAGQMAGAAGAGMAVEPLAEYLESGHVREHPIREGLVQGALGALPGVGAASTIGKTLLKKAAAAAAQGAAADVGLRAARDEPQSLSGTGEMAAFGGALGVGGHYVEKALTSEPMRALASTLYKKIEAAIPARNWPPASPARPQDVPLRELGGAARAASGAKSYDIAERFEPAQAQPYTGARGGTDPTLHGVLPGAYRVTDTDVHAYIRDSGIDDPGLAWRNLQANANDHFLTHPDRGDARPDTFAHLTTQPSAPKTGVIEDAWDATKRAVTRARDTIGQATRAAWDWYNAPPRVDSFDQILGARNYGNAQSGARQLAFHRDMRTVPREWRRAINAWVAEGGDPQRLQDAMNGATTPALRRKYENALNLPEPYQELARDVRIYFDQMIDVNVDAGITHGTIDDYLHRVWKERPPTEADKKLWMTGNTAPFAPNPAYTKTRVMKDLSEADAEALGYRSNDDVAYRVAHYAQSFDRANIDRATIHDMFRQVDPEDGRPLAVIRGAGTAVGPASEHPNAAFLVRPQAQSDRFRDYVPETKMGMSVPQMQDWRWIGKDADGRAILMRGDAVIHPKYARRFANEFGQSKIQTSQSPFMKVVRNLQKLSTIYKQTKFSLSPFHQVQIAEHAMGHGFGPHDAFAPPPLAWDNPHFEGLLRGGMTMMDPRSEQMWSDSLTGGGLVHAIPGIGQLQEDYTTHLFQDLIPRTKAMVGINAAERNIERYPDLTLEQVYKHTAEQMNNAFGGQNWGQLGVNRTTQDVLRLIFQAPDFNLSRLRFMGQGLLPYNAEQRTALMRLALSQYITARIVNKAANDDYHWGLGDIPFGYKVGDTVYQARTVPGDFLHLYNDPRSWLYHRLNPLTAMPEIKAMFGDIQGRKSTAYDILMDTVGGVLPITSEGVLNQLGLREGDQRIFQAMLSGAGLSAYPYKSPTERQLIKARAFVPGTPESSESARARMAERRVVDALRAGDTAAPGDLSILSQNQMKRALRLGQMQRFEGLLDGAPFQRVLEAYGTSKSYGNKEEMRIIQSAIAKRFDKGRDPFAGVKPGEMASVRRMLDEVTADMKAEREKMQAPHHDTEQREAVTQ